MAREIERKFLVQESSWRAGAVGVHYRQGYLHSSRECSVRVRIAGEQAFLTIKGATLGMSRDEYEYAIPMADALAMLDHLCPQPQIEKIRYRLEYCGFFWEIDEFLGENQGLIVAEIELPSEEQIFALPDWVGIEVTGEAKYYNACLCRHPFRTWNDGKTILNQEP